MRATSRAPRQRLIAALAPLTSGGELIAHRETAWASITFAGTRHTLIWRFSGDALAQGEQLIADLPDFEFALPRQLVADAAICEVCHTGEPAPSLTVTAEVLLLEEC
jgi:hypothetical protein